MDWYNSRAMFRKVLIANRGEIAVRIVRACRELGVTPVAVYSDADRKALHVRMAAEAYAIGPAPASESYLHVDRIMEAARKSRAEAVHPGYGFLSENPALPRACEAAGLVFIGPSAASMEMMGSKINARQAAVAAGVAVVPGVDQAIESPVKAAQIAKKYGYPVLIKAAAGGGGKGMRIVRAEADMASAFRDAQSEAENAFGNPEVYLERYIERPRHIEVQVFGDRHGNVVHLGERECSIQRRHQKVLEECPSPFVDAEMRRRMGDAAVRVARAAGYYIAGTVEFLVDQQKSFYFLEMNTRLQVEHPVTELVTGLDLVRLQFHVAAGEPLPFRQEDVGWRGSAMECRIYAEDPDNNFFPSPGKITSLVSAEGPGVRMDSGVYEGWSVPIEYDPLIAKLIAWGTNRGEAIERLRRALAECRVAGIKTNIRFFERLLTVPEFLAGDLDTGFLDHLPPASKDAIPGREEDAIALTAAIHESRKAKNGAAGHGPPPESPWKRQGRLDLLREE
jgi:acetyl-CoA carboxylase biotin carboxylase subunit